MKFKNHLLVCLLLVSVLFSCQHNDDEIENSKSVELDKNDPVINEILKRGFKIEDILEYRDFYLVQGDIMFPKDINKYENHLDKHASTNNLVSQDYRIVTVSIDSSIPTSGVDAWRTAIESAMSEWSSITGTSIAFVSYHDNNPDIVFKSDNNILADNVIASATFPLNGRAGNQIIINLDFNSNATVSESSKKYNIVHELGHCIGFRHTNWDVRGETAGSIGANLIPNTPDQDPNSVMNGGTANYSWSGFSNYDLVAVRYLYSSMSCNSRLSGPNNLCAYNSDNIFIDYNVYLLGSKQTVSTSGTTTVWSVSGNDLEIVSTYANQCKIRPKSTNTNWPATGTVTKQNGSCSTTFFVSLNNCIDYSYSD